MPDSSTASAPARLIEIRPSRRLRIWWLAWSLVLALAAFMVSAWAGWVAVPLLGFCVLRCQPTTRTVMFVTRDGRFLLPDENQSHLALTAASRSGPGWLRLSFADRPGPGLLLLRDQVDAGAWRVLRIAILESR